MSVEIKQLPASEVEIFIEVSAEDFEKYHKESFEEISKNVSLPGFRPGKIPREILEKNIDSGAVLKRAAELAIQKTYFPVLAEKKIEAIGRPQITITKIAKDSPFCYKVKIAILPKITLPDYKKIALDIRGKEEFGVKDGASEEEKGKIRQKKRMKILEAISDSSEMEIPEILAVTEKEKMLGELKSSIENMGMKWPDYLNQIKKTDDDLKKDWHDDAISRIKYGLILRELAEKENIKVSAEELEKETAKILEHFAAEKNDISKIDINYLKSYTYGIIRNEKVFNFLETC